MAHPLIGKTAYQMCRHLALLEHQREPYDEGMEVAAFLNKTVQRIGRRWSFRRGPGLAALLLLLLLILGSAGVWLINHQAAARAGAAAPVVVNFPLKAVHSVMGLEVDPPAGLVSGPSGKADLPADFYDFGLVPSSAVVTHEFTLVNHGSGPLRVLRAYTTCGCTSAEVSASVIPPGKASRITVTFDAGFHPVAGQTVRRGVVLETNDPDRPQVEIWVQARIGD